MNSTAAPPTASDVRDAGLPVWLLWLGLAIIWLGTTQLYPLLDPDEGRYAEIPREMAASGDWITPRLDGLKYLEKPPLQYWATAALYKGFGLTEWTARAWPLTLAFLCLPLTFFWVRRLYGGSAAFGSLAVLAASPFFVLVGHINVLDGAFTFWLTAMIFAFTLAQSAPGRSSSERTWMLSAWVAAALAVLSKGLVAPVLAGLTLVIYCAVRRDFAVWRRLHFVLGLPIFLLIAAPWFVAVSLRNPEFLQFFFLHEHFARFLTTVHRRTEPWWYFLQFAALALLPWFMELRAAMRNAWRQPRSEHGFEALRFLLIYCGVVLLFFSISQSKLPPYILPIVPALAVVIGVHIAEKGRSLRRAAWIGALTVGAVAGGLVVYALRRYDALPPQLLAWGLLAAIVAMLAAFNIATRRSFPRNAVVLAAASMLAWQCLIVAFASPPSPRSARALVHTARPHIGAESALYSVGQYRQTVPPYLGRTLTLVNYAGELEFGLKQEPGRNSTSLAEFKRRWLTDTDAVAFIEPKVWDRMAPEGLPGRVLARDRYSVVVSRR